MCYNLHQSKADPTQFMFYEQWASKEAIDAHGKTPHMKALGGKLKDKTDKGGGLRLLRVVEVRTPIGLGVMSFQKFIGIDYFLQENPTSNCK